MGKKQTSFDDHHVDIKWFADGTLNVSYNCLDRHLETRGDQVAIIWEGDDPSEHKEITYRELHEQVCKFANALKARGVKFEVCEITLRNRNLKKEQFNMDAEFTPSGVARIAKLQTRDGYAYITP